jgi:hypothetical protein
MQLDEGRALPAPQHRGQITPRAAGLPEPDVLDFFGRFESKLSHEPAISRPDPNVLRAVKLRLAPRLIGISNTDDAVDLYREAQNFPGASTEAHIYSDLQLKINGPAYPGFAFAPRLRICCCERLGRYQSLYCQIQDQISLAVHPEIGMIFARGLSGCAPLLAPYGHASRSMDV